MWSANFHDQTYVRIHYTMACMYCIYIRIYGIMMYNTAVTGACVYIIVIIHFTLHVRNLKRRGMQSSDCKSTLKYMQAQFVLKCAEYYYSANNILIYMH